MYSSSAKLPAAGTNRMLKPSTRPPAFATQTRYSGAPIMAAIQLSRFCSRAAIEAA